MINENLKVWLSFDASTTEDKCGNSWTANGSPTVSNDNAINGKALQLNGSSYLSLDDGIELGGKSFSIDCWFHMDAATDTNASIFCLFNQKNTTSSIITVARYNKDNALVVGVLGHLSAAPISNLTTGLHHLSAVYNHVINVFSAYLDGSFIYSEFITIPATSFTNLWLGRLNYDSAAYFRGSIDEFKIYDDTILRTSEFTPPTSLEYTVEKLLADGYAPLDFCADVERRVKNTLAVSFTADVERKVRNALTTWRYENAGNANDLILSSTILTDLPESKSVTGTAFYQTTRAKCFDLPATPEIWIKFDVYFDGSNRWRAYNGGDNSNPYNVGVTAQTDGALSLVQNSAVIQNTANVCKRNQLQTVLLHMVSGSSAGVIEAWVDGEFIYRYTGDVNHGEDFADIYLQSDGAGTFFSNVIISNAEIDLGEGWKKFSVDLERKLSNAVEVSFDVERKLCVSTNFFADVVRTLTASCQSVFDVEIRYTVSVQVFVDVLRNIPMKLIFMPTDTRQYFSGGSSGGDSSDDDTEPVVIPSYDVPITDSSQEQALQTINVTDLQSFEIVLSEQQLTPQITFTLNAGDSPPDIMKEISGRYLDYEFTAKIESVRRQGTLATCRCCHDLDELIYTQLDFTEPESDEPEYDSETGELIVKTKTHLTGVEIAKKIANGILNQDGSESKKPYKLRFRKFTSTFSDSDIGGLTYADLISSAFGWTSRLYTWLMNVFFVGKGTESKLYFIQRGKEENVIDISDSKHTLPIITEELIRLFWGSSPTTETRIESEDPEDDDDDEEQGDDDDEDEEFASGKDTTYGPDCVITTNYSYSSSGLLRKVTIKKIYTTGDKPNSNTTIKHSYDSDGTRTKTTTETTYSGKNPPPDSKTVNSLSYITLSNGEKFLSKESVEYYEDGDLVDFSVTTHSPSRIGQTHSIKVTDDGIAGETSGQNTGDDRITPYRQRQAKTLPADNNDNDKPASWGKTKKTTINGRTDFDTTFPVSDTKTLELITDELKKLNRSIKTTVSLTIYDFPHLINFQDRIKFNGDEYWLVSNTARTTYQIKNEQNLVLIAGGERYDGEWTTDSD